PKRFEWPRFPIEIETREWTNWVGISWAAIAGLMLIRLVASCIVLERRKRLSFSPPQSAAARLKNWLHICQTRRRIALAASSQISTPMAAGVRRPSILIPVRLFSELAEHELDQIGLHETAHFARRDDYALILQRLIEVFFALHPAVRWI